MPERNPLEALADPEQWSWAAPRVTSVAPRGSREALRALVDAYGQRTETSRQPLLSAMESIGGVAAVTELGKSASADDRRLAGRLAHLLPDPSHLSTLQRLVSDPDRHVAAEARAALRTQPRDVHWRDLVRRLAESEDPELSSEAQAWEQEGKVSS